MLQKIIIKLIALFAVIRGYNIVMLLLALYFTAYFIFSPDRTLYEFINIYKIHLIILSSALSVAAGYIINNFYDFQKDKLARPLTTYISKLVNQNFKLKVYLTFNLLAVIFAFLASWRVALFFIVYQLLIWFYSHKISKIVFFNNIFLTIISLFPFLAFLLYYNNYAPIIFLHGAFLGLLLLISDISKDLYTQKADIIYNYGTIVSEYGYKTAKIIITILFLITSILGIYMQGLEEVGHMELYFSAMVILLLLLSIILWFINEKWEYLIFQYTIKVLLGVGVISVAWIKINPLDLQKFFIIK